MRIRIFDCDIFVHSKIINNAYLYIRIMCVCTYIFATLRSFVYLYIIKSVLFVQLYLFITQCLFTSIPSSLDYRQSLLRDFLVGQWVTTKSPPAPLHHLSHNRKITFFLFGEPIGISENLVYAHDYNHVVIFEHIEGKKKLLSGIKL